MRKLDAILKLWKKAEFGDVRLQEESLIEFLKLIKRKRKGVVSEIEVNERKQLQRQLGEIFFREILSWYQKTKTRGVIELDNNSKLFHRIANGGKPSKIINKSESNDGRIS
jgi:hypothetical protein